MGDTDETAEKTSVPSWQRADSATSSSDSTTSNQSDDSGIAVARRFLDDDEVKSAPRDKKVAFLKAKGISDENIQSLLGSDDEDAAAQTTTETETTNTPIQTPPSSAPSSSNDRPPIVTYPEFLTKPARPPPFVTTDRLLAALYSFAGLSTILYGTSRFVVSPMVDALTDARIDLHEATSRALETLNTQLEKSVSVVPPVSKSGVYSSSDDGSSEADDPSEMFHRDVGTQTSNPLELLDSPSAPAESPSTQQADRVSSLVKSLAGLRDDIRSQGEDYDNVRTVVDVLRDEVDALSYAPYSSSSAQYSFLSPMGRRAEPEDEIRKAKDNIRRVKGILLQARNFPASVR
jgi:hypothetical protein